ncbi:MAG: hypothetical protein IJD57_01760 [Candidatus Gastranaerophilales bacterium]|nr:hypothetical protein [Candidatus Gastranaerophilales bacterium]
MKIKNIENSFLQQKKPEQKKFLNATKPIQTNFPRLENELKFKGLISRAQTEQNQAKNKLDSLIEGLLKSDLKDRKINSLVYRQAFKKYENYEKTFHLLSTCSDKDFRKKLINLQKRPLLKSVLEGKFEMNFASWLHLLELNDEEYKRYLTPIEKRTPQEFDKKSFVLDVRKKIEESIEAFEETTKKETLEKEVKTQDNSDELVLLGKESNYCVTTKEIGDLEARYPFEKLPKKPHKYIKGLASTSLLMLKLMTIGESSLSIKDKGGAAPVRNENALIREEDKEKLNKTQNAGIAIRYGSKINWSEEKIARDIMQNFFDGNGYTLEGTTIKVKRKLNGSCTIRIEGLGKYDYSHLETLGDSSKDNDFSSAGCFGEGTRIVAANLLSKRDTNYIKYASGDWSFEFKKSSKNNKDAVMTQTLRKNDEHIEGNYIEFDTSNLQLINRIFDSKNYFYHPNNPDFFNLDYENEYFGFRFLPKSNGDLYLIQKFEYEDKGNFLPLKNFHVVFKRNPNSPELVEKNNGNYLRAVGRDRTQINSNYLTELFARYVKTISDEDLCKIAVSLKPCWDLATEEKYEASEARLFLNVILQEAKSRKIGIDFDKEKYICLDSGLGSDFAKCLGYKLAIKDMEKIGMKSYVFNYEITEEIKEREKRDIVKKICIADESVKVFEENLSPEERTLLDFGDSDKLREIYCDSNDCTVAEAIIEDGIYHGHKVNTCHLDSFYSKNLETWLHEMSHRAGSDTSKEFSEQMMKMQQFVIRTLMHNPVAIKKLIALREIYDPMMYAAPTKRIIPLNQEKFEKKAQRKSDKKTHQKSYPIKSAVYKPSKEDIKNALISVSGIKYPYRKIEAQKPYVEIPSPANAFSLLTKIHRNNELNIELKNQGGAKPTNTEKAKIKEEDIARLNKPQSAKIAIRYGSKINWDESKIARDIMQNFYDGNGHTLEGTKIKISRNDDYTYRVRVEGLGKYDYSHLQTLGSSTKENDTQSAGFFGEGTRIVAVSLLSNEGTSFVKYGCGDWNLEFNRSTDDIASAIMTETLTKNDEHLEGNYIEFDTKSANVVLALLQAKDYFYHPENPDFFNLDFENEYFGFKYMPDDNGNLYYIQRYRPQYESIDNGVKNLNIIFKKTIKAINKHFDFQNDRDRNDLSHKMVRKLTCEYAKTMKPRELISAIATLEEILSTTNLNSDKLAGVNICNSTDRAFLLGLIDSAVQRGIRISSEDSKLVWINNSKNKDQTPLNEKARHYFIDNGFRFVNKEYAKLGIVSAEQYHEKESVIHSQEANEKENKKLNILYQGLSLITNQIYYEHLNEIKNIQLQLVEDNDTAELFKRAYIGKKPAVCINKKALENMSYIEVLVRILSEFLDKNQDKRLASYSYDLSKVLEEEICELLRYKETGTKLKILEKLYNEVK